MMVLWSLHQLSQLRKNLYLEPSEVEELRLRKLKSVVKFAYENVGYYKKLFDSAKVKPGNITALDDLRRIPITTKSQLQSASPDDIVVRGVDISKCVVKFTSGSTGIPLKMLLSRKERDLQILFNLRILLENGLKLTDKVTYLINPHRFPKSKYWFQYLSILRRNYLSVFDDANNHVEALQRLKPDVIYGYPSNITLLALALRNKKENKVKPRLVFSSAEALEPKARQLIESVFGVSVCDILGTIELGDILWECNEHKGYHENSDSVIIEFLKDGEPVKGGEEGKIVCTSLFNYTMPLIRYAIDDICVPTDRRCSCGITFPLVEKIQGRANDFIVLPDGRIIASCFLVIIMQGIRDILQYRVIQEQEDKLLVQVVKGANYSEKTALRIREEIKKVTHGKLGVEVQAVDQFSRDQSGKIRTVISKIIPDFQDRLV